jgi:hypothetical protein
LGFTTLIISLSTRQYSEPVLLKILKKLDTKLEAMDPDPELDFNFIKNRQIN